MSAFVSRPVGTSSPSRSTAIWPYLGIFGIALLGAWLRLDQFSYQVVTDDEWHALHQLIANSPSQFMRSFGTADYSIPLAGLYWLEAHWFGLSEFGMRWPMLASGLAILILFPLWALPRFGWRVAAAFALLLAISPLLINYSREARPYAITLFLSYLAHYAFWRFWATDPAGWRWGALYGLCASLAVWLHLLSLPFVTVPFILAGWQTLAAERGARVARVRRLLWLAVPTALLMALLILPPMVSDPNALLNKSGSDMPNWDTYLGVLHTWLGTPSLPAVTVCILFALFGVSSLWREGQLIRGVLLGLLLTYMAVLISRPAWVHNPLTFGRYLLPAVVVLLLAVALGMARMAQYVEFRMGRLIAVPVVLLPFVFLLLQTPLLKTMRKPDSYSLHSVFQVDYRKKPGGVRETMRERIPLSPWWETLSRLPPESVLIAVAPYQYFSPKWDAPRWEKLGKQRVIPGFLTGFCLTRRDGEAPDDVRFVLRNAVHLGDDMELRTKHVGMVVFQKPYLVVHNNERVWMGADVGQCLPLLRNKFGAPVYEDDKIVAFLLRNPDLAHAQ